MAVLTFAFRRYAMHAAMIVVLLAGAVWLAQDLYEGREHIISEKRDLVVQRSQFMSQWFGTTILSTDYVLRDILGRLSMADLAGENLSTPWQAEMSALLAQKAGSVAGIDGITIYGPDCIFMASADPRLVGIRSNQTFCHQQGIQVDTDAYIQYMPTEKSASRRPVILISRNLAGPDGKLIGGVLAAINLSYAQSWLESFAIGANDVLALADGDGTLLARHPLLPDAIGRKGPPPPGQPSFGATRSSASFIGRSPFDGHRRIFGISKIERIPMVVLVGLDMDDVLAEWRHRAWQFGLGYLVLSVLSLLLLRAHTKALRQREEMRTLAITDPLTGVTNRRSLVETGMQEEARSRRYGHDMAVLILDIDYFKAINDTWGHPTGDRAIQDLAKTMRDAVRDHDVIGRLGGEEFAVVLPQTDLKGGGIIAERLRQAVADIRFATDDGQNGTFTVSIGVAALQAGDADFEAVLSRADRALYQAKEAGRNRVMGV